MVTRFVSPKPIKEAAMACAAPITVQGTAGPFKTRCKQCLPCRIYNQSSLTLQCLLENHLASSAQFVTLTYENAPERGDYSDFSLFLKRLLSLNRRRENSLSIRHLGVGEYGDTSGRFHYHALIWNSLIFDQEVWATKLWPQGYSRIGQVTPASIRYTARYNLKFSAPDMQECHGSSKRPPLGEPLMTWLGEQQKDPQHRAPPNVLNWDGKTWPVNTAMQIAWAEGAAPHLITRNAAGTRILVKSAATATLKWMLDAKLGDPLAANRAASEMRAERFLKKGLYRGKL